jgi:membrane protein implicated in regulation of membrane protease activity
MSTVFLYCAVIGGTILVLQFVLLAFGAGADTDVETGAGDAHTGDPVGHDQSAFLKLISLQTIATFLTFFGLIGLGTQQLGWSPLAVAGSAVIAGIAALFFVVRMMQALGRLQSHGNLDLANAVGHTGSVYLRVPAAGQGHGRVLMTVQGRTVECRAVSRAAEIPTGASIRVLARTDDDVLVVAPADAPSA